MFSFLAEVLKFLRDIFLRIFRVRSPEEKRQEKIEKLDRYYRWLQKEKNQAYIDRDGLRVAAIRDQLRSVGAELVRLRNLQGSGDSNR